MAAPAALLAAGAWVVAQGRLDYDLNMITGIARGEFTIQKRQKEDRLNVFYILEQHALAKKSADRIFLIFEEASWTYREFYDIALKYGTWLKTKYAVQSGDVVAMDLMNCPTFLFLWIGLWSIGARPAFINYNLTAEPLVHSIKTSGTAVVFVGEDLRSKFTPEVLKSLGPSAKSQGGISPEIVFMEPSIEREIMNTSGVRQPDSSRGGVKRADMAMLVYTSGTTGLPKAAIVSWQKVLLGGIFLPHWLGMKVSDRYYTCMPLYHSSAALLGFSPTLIRGSTVIIGHRFSNKTFWPEVRRHEATIIQYVGETCRYLLAAAPQLDPSTGANLDKVHKVRAAFGNGLRPDVWERFKERFGIENIGEFYSATEAPAGLWNFSSNRLSSGAIGRNGVITNYLLHKFAFKIVAIDWDTEAPRRDASKSNFCELARTGEPGELLFNLDPADVNAKYQGYYGNKTASESKILRDVFVKGDAYFRSGDVIRCDSEGRWWFCDRIGDTFRWKSENVSTTEVGEALGSHPHVYEANVYGVQLPHHDGRIGCAAILFDEAHSEQILHNDARNAIASQAFLQDVANHARSKLPNYAVPGFLRVVKQVVATGNNKQQKTELKKEGVDPSKVGTDLLFWLRGGTYVPFGKQQWQELNGGRVRL